MSSSRPLASEIPLLLLLGNGTSVKSTAWPASVLVFWVSQAEAAKTETVVDWQVQAVAARVGVWWALWAGSSKRLQAA